MFYIIWDEH